MDENLIRCGSDIDEWLGVLRLCRGVAPQRCDRYVVARSR